MFGKSRLVPPNNSRAVPRKLSNVGLSKRDVPCESPKPIRKGKEKESPRAPSLPTSPSPPPTPTNESHAAQLARPQVRMMLFNNLGMDKGITVEGEPALRPCIRLKSDPPEFQAEADYHNEELTCQSGWTRTLVINGFSKASVNVLFPMVSGELSGASGSKHKNSASGFEKFYYRIEYFSKGLVQLNRELFEPTEDFERHVRDALGESNSLAMYGRLKDVWDRFGYVISQKVSIGGKLTLWETFHESKSDTDRSSFRVAKANVAAVWNQLAVGSGVEVYASNGQSHSAGFSIQQSQGMVIGGDPTSSAFLHGRQSWEDSLMRDVHSWKVIKRERIVPIYEFLSDDLRDQVRNVMNAAINLQRIRPDTVFKVRSCNTKHCLAWQKFYYAQQKGYTGMVVCTSPLQSGTSNDNISWNFVVADTSTESFTSLATIDTLAHAPDVYLRYNDVIYIQPATIPDVAMKKKDREHYPIPTPSRRHAEDPSRRAPSPLPQHNPLYLHGSHNNRSPVTKTAPECSLRFFKSGKPNQADQWVIERVDDEAWDSFGSDIDVDAAIRRTAYVLKTDRFRLRHRATDGHYLCSHNETIEKIDVRKRPDDLIPRSIGGVHGAGVLARHYHEVLLLTRKECGEQKDEWEFFQIDARERS